jgi:hypothetical protein
MLPVTTTLQLFDAWCRGYHAPIREAVFEDIGPYEPGASPTDSCGPSSEAVVGRGGGVGATTANCTGCWASCKPQLIGVLASFGRH